MNLKFLGTGASEGIPAVFCHCSVCEYARKNKGKNIRTRSQAIVDNRLLIDFGPDSLNHSHENDINFADIQNCLITHCHSDHLYAEDLRARRRSRANLKDGTQPLYIYGGIGVEKTLLPDADGRITKDGNVIFRRIEKFKKYKIDQYEIIPLPAIHSTEDPYVFFIKSENGNLLYAHDSDILEEESFHFLNGIGANFDCVSLDCTEGAKHIDYIGHMNYEKLLKMRNKLYSWGLIREETIVIANHFSHNGLVNYEDSLKWGELNDILISYDGMEVSF